MSAEGAGQYFDELVSWASTTLQPDEILFASLTGEDSDFCRFNHAQVRQAGTVRQRHITLDLVAGRRHADGSLVLTADQTTDRGRISDALLELRERRRLVPEDPYLLYPTEEPSTTQVSVGHMPDPAEVAETIATRAEGCDLVGIYAAGTSIRGFASSLGQRNFFATETFNFDWSIYHERDKAVKNLYGAAHWQADEFEKKMSQSIREVDALRLPARELDRGDYRTYLSPMAVGEIVEMLERGGFGVRAERTKRSPLLAMTTEGKTLHPSVTLSQDISTCPAPDFQSNGFARPSEMLLIDGGQTADLLVSPRSSREYGVATNGAENDESPVAVSMTPGAIPADDILDALGTGLYVGNLWYLNFSDRAQCRITGMTRFGTFWVENGEVVAPVDVLRFDDTIYSLLGDRLLGLTDRCDAMPDSATYDSRSVGGRSLPGALVEAMTFTL